MATAAQGNPGKFQAYDPMTPYQAPVMPEPQPAMPSPLPTQMPEINGAVKKSGAIATVADGILRGFMQGRAFHQAKEVMQLKKKSDDLQNSYNQDAVRLYQLKQAGISETSDEWKAAKSSVDGSWGALQDFYGSHIEQMEGTKKGKSKKGQQQLPPQAVLSNPASTPFEKAQAWHQVAKAAGPPVYGQIAMLDTPEAKAQRAARQQAVQADLATANNAVAEAATRGVENSNAMTVQQALADVYKLGPQVSQYPSDQNSWTQEQKDTYKKYLASKEVYDDSQERRTGIPKLYKRADGSQVMLFPSQVREDDEPAAKPTASELKREDFDKAVKEGYNGSFEAWTAEQTAAGHRAGAPPVRGGGAGGSGRNSPEAVKGRLREAFPEASDEEIDNMARQKMFGKSIASEGNLAALASSKDPAKQQQFDSSILENAVGNLRSMDKYKEMPDFDDALANIVGKDEGGQYHYRPYVANPRKDGGYSGNAHLMDEKDEESPSLQSMERDLQRLIMTAVTQAANKTIGQGDRAAALRRMAPIVGKAQSTPGSGPAASPQPQAAQPGAAASSPSPSGGSKNQFMATPNPKGLKEPGNLPIWNRPTVRNADGTHSSEYSTSFQDSKTGYEVLVPTIVNGKFLTPDGKKPREGSAEEKAMFKKAWDHYLQTGENLGKFDSPANADAYANALHNRGAPSSGGSAGKTKSSPKPRTFYLEGEPISQPMPMTDEEVEMWKKANPDYKAKGISIQ